VTTDWQTAFRAEAEAHKETRGILDNFRRQAETARAQVSLLEVDLGLTQRKLARAEAMLGMVGVHKLPEEPKHDGSWYSCAVCSTKTNAAPSKVNKHACCASAAYLGPCCHKALENYPENVNSILATSGHRPGCRGGA